MAKQPSTDPHKFDEALKAWRARVPMKKGEFEDLEASEKEFAFTVANVAQMGPIVDTWRAIDGAIEKGTTLEDFKVQVGQTLAEAWGGENPAAVETIFRTNIIGAYGAGRHAIYSAPAVKEARPFLRFDAIHDDRTDEDCEACDGTLLPQDDGFWGAHTPPLHFNCRCIVTPVSPEEADQEGVSDDAPDLEVDDGFGRPPASDGEDWKPNLGDYPSGLRDALADKLK
jgi:SPP1 gp7 family putative phage head morphogenesis protein